MNLLETITGQVRAMGEPLFAVTLTALPRANTPVLLMLHWHGFRRNPDAAPPRRSPIPSSALQLNERWMDMGVIDQAMLDAAWELGAWQLDREERRSCAAMGASVQEAMECRQAFGEDPRFPGDERHLVAEAPDRQEMMVAGARTGYVRWQFRPVRGGIWKDAAADDSLGTDGGRMLPCPVSILPLKGKENSRTRYLLGRIDRIFLP